MLKKEVFLAQPNFSRHQRITFGSSTNEKSERNKEKQEEDENKDLKIPINCRYYQKIVYFSKNILKRKHVANTKNGLCLQKKDMKTKTKTEEDNNKDKV